MDSTTPDFREQRYLSNSMPWDFHSVPPALVEFLRRTPSARDVLLPGCGSGSRRFCNRHGIRRDERSGRPRTLPVAVKRGAGALDSPQSGPATSEAGRAVAKRRRVRRAELQQHLRARPIDPTAPSTQSHQPPDLIHPAKKLPLAFNDKSVKIKIANQSNLTRQFLRHPEPSLILEANRVIRRHP